MSDPPTLRRLVPAFVLVAACGASSPPVVSRPTAPVVRPARSHALEGVVYDVRAGRPVERSALEQAVFNARFVVLGETHDNREHHLEQAGWVHTLGRRGRRPAVVFEMFDVPTQPAIDRVLAGREPSPDAIAQAVDFANSHWPDWSMYRPIVARALEHRMRLVAGNIPTEEARAVVTQGESGFGEATRAILRVSAPYEPPMAQAVLAELQRAHCGQMPEAMLGGMFLVQRARDAAMAHRMLEASVLGTADGAVLITGAGHARRDRGVPWHLRSRAPDAPEASVLSVAFLEVEPEWTTPSRYAERYGAPTLPFDFVVFTGREPTRSGADPCAAIATQR